MRTKIKVYCPSFIWFPRQVRKFMAFKLLWATVPSCKHSIMQGPQELLVLSPRPPGEAQLCWLQPALPFPPLHHRDCMSIFLQPGMLLERAQQNSGTRCGEQGPVCGPESLKGWRALPPFGKPFPTTEILLMNLMHLISILCVSSAWTFFY